MNHLTPFATLAALASVLGFHQAYAGIFIDTSPGTAAPPSTLGGYSMIGFPADPSAEGSMISSLTPPASAPVTGNLTFSPAVAHSIVPSSWGTWSHGYTGDVYYNASSELMLDLPTGTLAFYLYVEPNILDNFMFEVTTESAMQTGITVNGNGGAQYVGVYSDTPLDSVSFLFVKQPDGAADGFAVGEFGINNVPEPRTYGLIGGLALLGFGACRKFSRS